MKRVNTRFAKDVQDEASSKLCSYQAEKIRTALKDVIESGDRTTRDLGGEAGTIEFTQALLDRL